jgi:Uma2 family endonuclease
MSSAAIKRYTVEEFFELEARSLVKHQYFNGEIFLLHPPDEQGMAGATASHNSIVSNFVAASHNALKGRGCRVFPSDMLVKCPSDLRTYPDVTIVCDTPQYEDERELTLLNPQVIVEVLSPSTEKYDRDEKFLHYQSIPSLQDYVLIATDRPLVQHFRRHNGERQWLLTSVTGRDARLELPSLGIQLCLADIFENVELPEHVPLLKVGRYDPDSETPAIPTGA